MLQKTTTISYIQKVSEGLFSKEEKNPLNDFIDKYT